MRLGATFILCVIACVVLLYVGERREDKLRRTILQLESQCLTLQMDLERKDAEITKLRHIIQWQRGIDEDLRKTKPWKVAYQIDRM